MSIRPVHKVIKSKPTLEGAGVHLRRAFGLPPHHLLRMAQTFNEEIAHFQVITLLDLVANFLCRPRWTLSVQR